MTLVIVTLSASESASEPASDACRVLELTTLELTT
jgi:hypothetical protein